MRRAAALGLATLIGCGDALGGGPGLELDIYVSEPAMTVTVDAEDWPQANCNFTITAMAEGEGEASWGDVKLRWFMGLDRAIALDSQTVAASEMIAAWGSERISAGQHQSITWEIWASYPYEVEAEFSYTSGGRNRSVARRRRCGPRPGTDEPLPSMSYVNAVPAADLEPGDTITLSYSVGSSGSGLWAVTVGFSGAFAGRRVFRGELQRALAGSLVHQVPATATLDDESVLTVFATDPFGRSVHTTTSLGAIVDHTAPALAVVAQGRFMEPGSGVINGTYFVGDSLEFTAVASDNHRIDRILWETTSGQRDSAAIGDSSVIFRGRVGFRADWTSGLELRVTARDIRGLSRTGVITSGPDLEVFPSIQRPTTTVMLGGGRIRDIAYDVGRDRAFVLISDGCCDSRVAVLSLATLQEVHNIPLHGYVPNQLDITASGDSLLIPVFGAGAVFVVPLRLGMEATPHAIAGGGVARIAIAANGKAFMSHGGGPGAGVVELDLATNEVRARPDAAGSDALVDITRSHDRGTVAVVRTGCAHVYDLATDIFSACTPLRVQGAPTTDLTGAHHLVGLDVYDAAFQFLRTVESVETMGMLSDAAITPAGDYVHHFRDFAGFLRSRVSDGALVDRTVLPFYQPHLISMVPDGSRLLMATDGDMIAVSRLIAIDLREELGTPVASAVFRSAWSVRQPVRPVLRPERTAGAPPVTRGGMRFRPGSR